MEITIKLTIIVSPSSKKPRLEKHLGVYKFYLKSPPIDGKANIELIKTIASFLEVGLTQVKVLHGQSSKKKIIEVCSNESESSLFLKLEKNIS